MSATPSTTTPDYAQAYELFLAVNPAYKETRLLDDLRRDEFARIDQNRHVYLDYTGGSLYTRSQLQAHMTLLDSNVFGNPHSNNPTSRASTELDESARAAVLRYFNADPAEYICVFTQNASGALKLVGEAYPFEPGGQYLLSFDNHNSVNGIREFARNGGSEYIYAPVLPPDLYIDAEALNDLLVNKPNGKNGLFAYPAQSNFSGVQHSLDWISTAHNHGWDVLLDAAAFAPTNCLDLSAVAPDFVTLSFYKMFGYPTGVGALIVRKAVMPKLKRPWFAGGTITIATVQGDTHFLHENEAAFEDGTINYLTLPAVEEGLRLMQRVDVQTIHDRVMLLTGWMIEQLCGLTHSNGAPLTRIYGPESTEQRGATVTLNFYDAGSKLIDYRYVENLAIERNISLRTGCFCNPGAGELAHGLTRDIICRTLADKDRMSFDEFIVAMTAEGNEEAIGAVRVSLGIASNFADVYAFIEFCKTLLS